MKQCHNQLAKTLVWTAALVLVVGLVCTGCRPKFPECRDDDDCKAEEGNATLLVCVNGQCQECAKDADCPKERPRCKDSRCVECVEDKDCPEEKPYCESNQCVYECDISADCEKRSKPDTVCKDHKCVPCPEDQEIKNGECVPKCKCTSDADCPEKMKCENCECVEKKCELESIHFDFNRYDLRPGDREILDRNAECLKSASKNVTIEGHCDERGTEEYNIALGDKRARAAQKYMKNLGVGDGQLGVRSYGENRPACNTSDEGCWAQNRRAEFPER